MVCSIVSLAFQGVHNASNGHSKYFSINKPELYWYEHVLSIFTDPIGLLSLGFEKLFGIKSTIMVDYSPQRQQKHAAGTAVASTNDYIGATWKFQWN